MTCRKNERTIDVGDMEQQFTLLLLGRRQKSIVFNGLWGKNTRKQDFRFEGNKMPFCNTLDRYGNFHKLIKCYWLMPNLFQANLALKMICNNHQTCLK